MTTPLHSAMDARRIGSCLGVVGLRPLTLFAKSDRTMKTAQSVSPSFNGGRYRRMMRYAVVRTNGGLETCCGPFLQ